MNTFDKIDNYFYSKDKKELVYTIVLLILVIGFLIYYFIFPNIQTYKQAQEKKYSELQTKYNISKNTLRVLQIRVSVLNKQIKEKQIRLTALKKQKMFYDELANLLDFAEFDQHKWANFVKKSVIDAKNKGINVVKVENKIYKINQTNSDMPNIVKRMDIGIQLQGQYTNFIYYLYNYENRKELIRVNEMNITSPSTFYVKFSIYGYDR